LIATRDDIGKLFGTHPSIPGRIARLEKIGGSLWRCPGILTGVFDWPFGPACPAGAA
jgi:hypothetical protein